MESVIKDKIYEIGRRMVKNTDVYKNYPDLVCEPEKGIMPRCLVLEERNPGAKGCAIVGINPGSSLTSGRAQGEMEFYKSRGLTYDAIVDFWRANVSGYKYYNRLRAVAGDLGFCGSILWTELVKCESRPGIPLSVQTIRDDIHRYLFEELKCIPSDWPLIAVGGRAFEILSFSFADRNVIGIPHPTGSYGQFNYLMDNSRIKSNAKDAILSLISNDSPICRAFKFKGKQWQLE